MTRLKKFEAKDGTIITCEQGYFTIKQAHTMHVTSLTAAEFLAIEEYVYADASQLENSDKKEQDQNGNAASIQ